MAAKPFSKERLNFFKFSTIVFDEFPKVLRRIFIIMWDNVVAPRPGFTIWYDTPAVRSKLLASEGGKTIPTAKSIEEWDCTALFAATIYAKIFGHMGLTLNDQYLKKIKLAPGSFHKSVQGPTGDKMETYALAIDQLRLLRNTLCHSSKVDIIQSDFDNYVFLVKNSLQILNIDTTFVDDICRMREDDFSMERVRELISSCEMKTEFQAQKLCDIEEKLNTELKVLSDIHTLVKSMKEEKGNTSGERISIVATRTHHPEQNEVVKLLAFEEGDVGWVIKKTENGWWLIELQGHEGWVPAAYWREEEGKHRTDESFHDHPAFWGKMSREKSEDILRKEAEKLSYLIRESDNSPSFAILKNCRLDLTSFLSK
ncbi:uncharacterized protein LOC114532091 isoform X2 [Dendronephthya gigantea]|uniref:uncharacterized protein LOC114532091 isoform X2 n=1 Tax=Dendronephthya gigantea TaxID=151771 RepID=UPI00106DA273|nr:uncharacterized protein LOC114532091 isoform X2 [Dendronephthya gigantea]